MDMEDINIVNTGSISFVTNDLKKRITDLKQSVQELNQFFISNNYICPHCNQHTLLISPSKSSSCNDIEDCSFEFTCSKCGFSEIVL